MDKYEFGKTIRNLEETLSRLGGIYDNVKILVSCIGDAIYDLENMRSDLEAFGDEISEDNKNEK